MRILGSCLVTLMPVWERFQSQLACNYLALMLSFAVFVDVPTNSMLDVPLLHISFQWMMQLYHLYFGNLTSLNSVK